MSDLDDDERRYINKNTKFTVNDEPKANEGRLIINLNDQNYVLIDGDIRIYLDCIPQTGGNNRAVKLQIIAPKDVPIQRHWRTQ